MTIQIYADEVNSLYVANGLVRLELGSYALEANGQVSKQVAGKVVLHLNGFLGLHQKMQELIKKMIEDGAIKTDTTISDTSKAEDSSKTRTQADNQVNPPTKTTRTLRKK